MSASEPVTVKLLDREFLVACPPEEKPGLIAAATYLDEMMRELRANAKSPGFDRLVVLTALSVTHEMLDLRQGVDNHDHSVTDGLANLRRKLEGALDTYLE